MLNTVSVYAYSSRDSGFGIRVSHRDSVTDLIRKGKDLERIVLARAVRQHLENRVLIYGQSASSGLGLRTVVFD